MARTRTQSIHDFILEQAAEKPRGLARRIALAYGISRQAANRHLDRLVEAGLLEQSGRTRAREYRLKRTSSLTRELRVTPVLKPERVWEDHVDPILTGDRPAFKDLCRGAFGELVRNALEHAGASWITFALTNNPRNIEITVTDDGVGILQALLRPLGVSAPREAAEKMVRLANARSADSPVSRLFLLARNFHSFEIRSAGCVIRFDRDEDAWRLATDDRVRKGTAIGFRARRAPVDASAEPGRSRAAVSG